MSAFTSGIDYVHNRNRFVVDIVEHKASIDNRVSHGYIKDFDYQNSQVNPKYVLNGGQTVYIYRNGSLVFEVTNKNDGVNHEHFYTSELGSYRLVRVSRTGEIIVDYSFKIVDGGLPSKSLDFSSDNPSSPTNKINDSITGLSNSLGEKIGAISTDFKSSLEKLDDIRSKVGSVISRLDSVNSNLTKMNDDINANFNNALSKMDLTNNHLSEIKDNLKTDKQPVKKQAPDYSKELENHRPDQNENAFNDNNTYFSEGSHKEVNDLMPSPNQEPKQWEGVQKPVEQIKDSELIKDTEKNRDEELVSDQEFLKDNELTKDQFENSEIYEKSDELIRDEFIKDNELSIDEFTADSELTKDQFNLDKELIKDVMRSDDELTKDEFDQTENYDNTNYFQQSEIYETDSENYNLRWKSIDGVYQ